VSKDQIDDKFIEINGSKIHYIQSGSGDPVILFHGSRFNAYTWKETNTLDSVAKAGFRAISVDFPGYGKSERGKFTSLSDFIYDFIFSLSLNKPFLLGASMGGEAVLSYSVYHPKDIKGLILVGAVGVKKYEKLLTNLEGVPILLIWGKKDRISSEENYKLIMNSVKTTHFVQIGNNHACYLDDPTTFNDIVTKFIKGSPWMIS